MLWAQSTTKDYIRAEHNFTLSPSYLFHKPSYTSHDFSLFIFNATGLEYRRVNRKVSRGSQTRFWICATRHGSSRLQHHQGSQQHDSAVIEESTGNILTESKAVLNWRAEYCSGLYNYELHPDTSLLQSNRPQHKRLKAYLCWAERLKRPRIVWNRKVSRSGQHPIWAV